MGGRVITTYDGQLRTAVSAVGAAIDALRVQPDAWATRRALRRSDRAVGAMRDTGAFADAVRELHAETHRCAARGEPTSPDLERCIRDVAGLVRVHTSCPIPVGAKSPRRGVGRKGA